MPKYVKIMRSKKISLKKTIGVLFVFSIMLSFFTTVFLRTLNQGISNEIQRTERMSQQIVVETESVEKVLANLKGPDRIEVAAQESGFEDNTIVFTIRP